MTADRLIFWLDELCAEHNDRVGKKCANLGELTRAGFRVPPGFVLSLEAYEEFLTASGAIDEIRQHFAVFNADPNDPKDLPKYVEAAKVIRNLAESKAMPKHIEDSVARHYDELSQKTGIRDVAVATRSAGPVSHPGQYETYLNIAGKSSLMDNIIKVWSSTFNTRSLIARARKGLPLEYDPIGVGVLKMVNAKAAGVMFTAEPNSADSSKIVIEGTLGLGESVVSGAVTPDGWVVDKTTFEIIERRVLPKAIDHRLAPKTDNQMGCLSDEEVLELAKTGKSIEAYFGRPQDIEWAIDSELSAENIVILQTRPEKINIEINFRF